MVVLLECYFTVAALGVLGLCFYDGPDRGFWAVMALVWPLTVVLVVGLVVAFAVFATEDAGDTP